MQVLDVATKAAGGVSELARKVGVAQGAVSNWRKRGRIPPRNCPAIEAAVTGAVVCEQMRPDLRWVRVPDEAWPWHPAGRPLRDDTGLPSVGSRPDQLEAVTADSARIPAADPAVWPLTTDRRIEPRGAKPEKEAAGAA